MFSRLPAAVFGVLLLAAGCAPEFQPQITPIKDPSAYRITHSEDGLSVGFHFLSVEEQKEHFGVDMSRADVVPVRVVVRNDSRREYFLDAGQVFGRTSSGDLYPVYRLDQSIERIRRSEVGRSMAKGAAAGIAVGILVGAASGAAVGGLSGGSGTDGAQVGAAGGAVVGGISGAGVSADATSQAIKRELRKVDWGSRVVYPGRLEHGFLFMKPGVAYDALEVRLHNVNDDLAKRVLVRVR